MNVAVCREGGRVAVSRWDARENSVMSARAANISAAITNAMNYSVARLKTNVNKLQTNVDRENENGKSDRQIYPIN